MHVHALCYYMGTTTISLNNEAYRVLKAQKREGESFSDLVLRKFGKGNPAAILTYLEESRPNMELAENIQRSSQELRKKLKTAKVRM